MLTLMHLNLSSPEYVLRRRLNLQRATMATPPIDFSM